MTKGVNVVILIDLGLVSFVLLKPIRGLWLEYESFLWVVFTAGLSHLDWYWIGYASLVNILHTPRKRPMCHVWAGLPSMSGLALVCRIIEWIVSMSGLRTFYYRVDVIDTHLLMMMCYLLRVNLLWHSEPIG